MDTQLLINVHKDQTALLYNLWAVFQGLALVLIGYTFSQPFVRESALILTCFSLSLAAFSVGNHSAIMRSQKLVAAAAAQLREIAKDHPDLGPTLGQFDAPDTISLSRFHWAFVVGSIAGLWVPYVYCWFEALKATT